MATHKLRILGIKWENVRNFEKLELGVGEKTIENEGWTLLQIQNNYGKTTTMHLLRSCLTGVKIGTEHLKGYRYRLGTTDYGGDPEATPEFSVMLSLDDEMFEIITKIDWKKGTQEFYTYRQGAGGRRPGWNPPEYFASLFENKDKLAELLILDGEVARKINQNTTGNVIGRSIRQVTGLSPICDLIDENGEEGKITELIRQIEQSGGEKRG